MIKTIILLISCLFISVAASAQVTMKRIDDGILFTEGNENIAFYKKEASEMGLDKGRCNYFHPVYLPDGTVITEDAPADHIHHRGIYWAWHQILVDSEATGDQWAMQDFIHDVKSVEFFRLPGGAGAFKTVVEWKSPLYEGGEEGFLEEKAIVNFFPQKKNYRIIQFEIQLKALVDNFQIGGSDDVKGYSGFSVRMKLPDDVAFSSVDGLVEPQNEAVETGNYINISGSVAKDSGHGGVMIFSANEFKTANHWILRKEKSMQNPVWPGRTPVAVSSTAPTVLKYAVVLYSGTVNESQVIKELEKLKWQ
jgi:hypothetical protein